MNQENRNPAQEPGGQVYMGVWFGIVLLGGTLFIFVSGIWER